MKLSDRQTQIIEFLSSSGGTLSSSELTDRFDVSVQTIRKDLNDLSDLGLVRRVHGGITLPTQSRNLSFTNRQVINFEEKKHIARLCASLIPNNSSLFLGIGTTPSQIAEHLIYHTGLKVITNNLNAALTLCHNTNIETYMVGGRVRHTDEDIVGEEATSQFRNFQVNFGICGVAGISESGSLLNFTTEESYLFKAILENCEKKVLVADHHKFMRSAPVKSGHLSDFDLFLTDSLPPELNTLCDDAELQVTTELTETN
ncbi:MAG: DeoR family glycerol-3-phosphate regulon repressor [Granulosicoccus sp.]|jgi:DeoR family glycerol-3-phosphate regulon repressor